jgi:hypothetical protein
MNKTNNTLSAAPSINWEALKEDFSSDYNRGYNLCFCSDGSEHEDPQHLRCYNLIGRAYNGSEFMAIFATMSQEDQAFWSGCMDGGMDT